MSGYNSPFLNDELSKRTVIFGLHMWVIIGIGVGVAFILLLFLISLWLASKRSTAPAALHPKVVRATSIPSTSKEIQEVSVDPSHAQDVSPPLPKPEPLPPVSIERQALLVQAEEEGPAKAKRRIQIEIGKDHCITYPERPAGVSSFHACGERRSAEQAFTAAPEVSHLGWGHWFTLRELEVATDMFSDENVIGEGGYGIVYRGMLEDSTPVAVKNLLNNRGQAERELKIEVEAIGRVRHKNLVRLLGYCAEGVHRILVYEYIDNGNLEQWIHGDVEHFSPLTWETRVNIVLGTAKGIVYLHEGLEPKVVHRDIKSSNILLDKRWNPKISDFGLAKLLGSESYVTTRVMGTFGYVAPEYASTGVLNERSDVYSFGILIMEIISGRSPVDYNRQPKEVNLVEWIKTMVTNSNFEGVLDPKLPEKPSSRTLKRVLLVALRCVDPDAQKRPKMGHVIHMLEVDDFPCRDDRRAGRTYRDTPAEKARLLEKPVAAESGDSRSGYESNMSVDRTTGWRKQEN